MTAPASSANAPNEIHSQSLPDQHSVPVATEWYVGIYYDFGPQCLYTSSIVYCTTLSDLLHSFLWWICIIAGYHKEC